MKTTTMTTSTWRSRSITLVTSSATMQCALLGTMHTADHPRIVEQVHEASTFLVVLTTQYLCSRKCMLGLLTAWRLRKPIVVLREADVRYGGLSACAFAEEVALYVARYGKGV